MSDDHRCVCGHYADEHALVNDDPEPEACEVCRCEFYEWDGEA